MSGEPCFICGRPIDNDDGTGYCSGCAADTGVYAQRASFARDETAEMSRALAALAEDMEAILQRLERVEARLAATEARLSLLEQTREGTSETVELDPGGGQDVDEAAPSPKSRRERFGIMNTPDSKAGYLGIVPEDSSWKNECPARIMLATTFYRPVSFAGRVKCPAFVLLAEKDALIPAAAVERLAERMPRAELVRVPVGHFDVYVGDAFEETASLEADFLERHLLG